ncbi:MAG: hypothetical protein AAF399_18900 [Bacteroidota bacterium]
MQEFLFGNLPSPQQEGMGRAGVALPGSPASYWFNPAGIGPVQDWSADLSTSAPFYVLRESDYYFAGFAKRIHPRLVAGLNLNQLAVGPTGFDITIDGQRYPLDRPRMSHVTGTLTGEVVDGLYLGVNAHLFNWKNFEDVSASNTLYLDAGALYQLEIGEQEEVNIGFSLGNLTGAAASFESPTGVVDENWLPIIARAGVSYRKGLNLELPGAGTQPLELLLTTEFQNVLNSEYRTAFRLGGQATVAQYIVLRLGFFTQSNDDLGNSDNFSRITDVTYGFGVLVPLDRLSDGKWPIQMGLDYFSLESPPATSQGTRLPNKRGFAIRLISSLPSNN